MSKKITRLFLIIFLGELFYPLISLAGTYQIDSKTATYEGLVPCGKCVDVSPAVDFTSLPDGIQEATRRYCKVTNGSKVFVFCQFCHFFVMIDGIFKFVLINLVPPIAVLMLVVGGIMFYFAGGRPELVTQGKKLIQAVIIGLVLAYGAYLIIGFVLSAIGAAQVSPIKDVWKGGIFKIRCPIELKPGGVVIGEEEEEKEEEEEALATHFVCENLTCVEKEGGGTDECSKNEDCWHFVCNASSICVKAGGEGQDQCSNENYSCTVECNNGIDDDRDGKIDYPEDSGCSGPGDNDETDTSLGLIACSDGIDNDGDGKIDYPDDPGCETFLDPSELNPNIQCDNGQDDDGDGKVDYRPVQGVGDPGCEDPWDNDERDESTCNDGIDNDNDGLTDMDDPGCLADPTNESNPNKQCDNGQDDDGDGKIDYKIDGSGDPQCENPLDNNEGNGIALCSDGIDNDKDGRTDYPNDPGCLSQDDNSEKNPSGAQCDDGINNDAPQDNLIDFRTDGMGDPQCSGPGDNDEWNGQIEEGEACNTCGEGLFNICDVDECHTLPGINGEGCHFKDGWIPHYCYECGGGDYPVDSCSDYLSQESCEVDPCGVGECLWEGGSCQELVVDPFEGYTLKDIREEQKEHASQPLMDLLSCMKDKLPEEARVISSISDDKILSGDCNRFLCTQDVCVPECETTCSHNCNSCHYGGRNCVNQERFSYAVDFAEEYYCRQIKEAALECNTGAWVNYEGNHVHVSVGKSLCGCNEQGEGNPCP